MNQEVNGDTIDSSRTNRESINNQRKITMKCKLNDLCFVIKDKESQLNLGKVVETVKYLGYFKSGEEFIHNNYAYISPNSEHYWIIKGNIELEDGPSDYGVVMDSWLLPFGDMNLLPIPTEPIEYSEISSKELEFN